jgi:hypothetical protein
MLHSGQTCQLDPTAVLGLPIYALESKADRDVSERKEGGVREKQMGKMGYIRQV